MWQVRSFTFIALSISGTNLVAQSINVPTSESGNHVQHCQEEWTKRGVLDKSMFRYCLRRQEEGYRAMAHEVRKYAGQPWMQSILDSAISKWSKRGARDDAMVHYEVNNQIDAYLDMEYAANHEGYNKEAFMQCKEDYSSRGPDWTLIRYCYKRKTDG